MPSTAVSAQGTKFYIQGADANPTTITGVSKAKNAVVTAANTLAVGDTFKFGVVTGMPEITGAVGVVMAASTSAFTVNVDTSGFGAVGTAGTGNAKTWVKVGNVHDYSGFDGSASEIDVTNLDSTAMEYRGGLQDFGNFSFTVDVDDSDPGHIALRAAKASQAILAFRLVQRTGAQRVFEGFVKKFGESGGVNGVLKTPVDVRVTGAVNFGALNA